MVRADPPYLRIAAEIRRRIHAGELGPGDRVPSTRQITREWGVAMATASKVLTVLRQEGLVQTLPGAGTVVRGRQASPRPGRSPDGRRPAPAPSRPEGRHPGPEPRGERIVRTAIRVADAEGLEALSMRRVAAELGTSVMSLYRHVSSKDGLVQLMVEAVFAEHPLPEPGPDGWRAKLELAARTQWDLYRRHPWVAHTISFTRPVLQPSAMAHLDWTLRALDGRGMDLATMLDAAIALSAYVRAFALSQGAEAESEDDTGMTSSQWWASTGATVSAILASGGFPMLSRYQGHDDSVRDLDRAFEFGLQRLLDGIAAFLADDRTGGDARRRGDRAG